MWSSGGYLNGIAFDTSRNILYWTSWSKIYRATIHETEPVTLLNAEECECDTFTSHGDLRCCGYANPKDFAFIAHGGLMGLAFDWIAQNLYVVTDDGYILVCNDDARASKVFRCVTLLNGQGYLRGIAVDPNEGYSYRNNALVTRNLASMILKFRHYALALYTTQGTPSRRM